MGTAIVIHGDEWARMSDRVDELESLCHELIKELKEAEENIHHKELIKRAMEVLGNVNRP